MTLHILSTTSPGKQPRKSLMSEPNSAADRVDRSPRGSKFFLCRSYYWVNQQLQRSCSNRSKSFMFLKLLIHDVTLHWWNICFLLYNRLDSLGEPSTRASFTSWWCESAVTNESGPVDRRPLHGTIYPQLNLWANALGLPGCSLPFCNGWHPPGLQLSNLTVLPCQKLKLLTEKAPPSTHNKASFWWVPEVNTLPSH